MYNGADTISLIVINKTVYKLAGEWVMIMTDLF